MSVKIKKSLLASLKLRKAGFPLTGEDFLYAVAYELFIDDVFTKSITIQLDTDPVEMIMLKLGMTGEYLSQMPDEKTMRRLILLDATEIHFLDLQFPEKLMIEAGWDTQDLSHEEMDKLAHKIASRTPYYDPREKYYLPKTILPSSFRTIDGGFA